jgi:hypothetical protein
MNRKVIIKNVEIYEKPKQFNMRPEWYHIKKIDHQVPEDIEKELNIVLNSRKNLKQNGITYNGITYYKKNYREYTIIENERTILLTSDQVPKEVISEIWDIEYGEPFRTGLLSNITGHKYIFKDDDRTLGFFPNQNERLSILYDEMFVHVQNIIDNFIGRPIKLKELPICVGYERSKYPDFNNKTFELSCSESSGSTVSVITRLFTIGKLHLTDLTDKKIISICSYCNTFKCEGEEDDKD